MRLNGDGDGEKKRSQIVDDPMEAVKRSGGGKRTRLTAEMRISIIRQGRQEAVKRQHCAGAGGKRKRSMKEEPKEDGGGAHRRSRSGGKRKKRSLKVEPKEGRCAQLRRDRSGRKPKRSRKDEPKEEKITESMERSLKDEYDVFRKIKRILRFGTYNYTNDWFDLMRRGPATEIPMPRLMELAAEVVDSYSKREGLDFEIVEAIKGFSVEQIPGDWNALNFKAKLKDSQPSDAKLFFGECFGEEVHTCCIIDTTDPDDFHRICDICEGEEQVLLYPRCGTTLSMFRPPASQGPDGSFVYEDELIKAGGSVETTNIAYAEFLKRTTTVGFMRCC